MGVVFVSPTCPFPWMGVVSWMGVAPIRLRLRVPLLPQTPAPPSSPAIFMLITSDDILGGATLWAWHPGVGVACVSPPLLLAWVPPLLLYFLSLLRRRFLAGSPRRAWLLLLPQASSLLGVFSPWWAWPPAPLRYSRSSPSSPAIFTHITKDDIFGVFSGVGGWAWSPFPLLQ